MPKDMGMSKEMSMNGRGGHLYMQTNEVKNAIIHYHRSAERHAHRGGTCRDRRCRFGDLQADQRPGERAQLF